MIKEVKEALVIRQKMMILEYARLFGNVIEACRVFGVPRSAFYKWKKAFDAEGKVGPARKKPIAQSQPRQLSPDVVDKILHLRNTCHLGLQRITWYLERYHGITISCSSV